MDYQLEASSQTYGDREYLSHKLPGATPSDDRYFFGQRIPSYGIFSFGAINSNSTKRVVLASVGILSPILLRSVYAFTLSATNEEIRFRLFEDNTEIIEQRITNSEMPYQFPDGAIVSPNLSIEVEPRYTVTNLLIYWQPVHIIHYSAV